MQLKLSEKNVIPPLYNTKKHPLKVHPGRYQRQGPFPAVVDKHEHPPHREALTGQLRRHRAHPEQREAARGR